MRKYMIRIRNSESGFTLIEMLIVVGIIVALAAAIIPQVVQFADRGTTGAKSAEQATMAVAIQNLMVDEGRTAILANTGNSTNDWTVVGTFYTSPANSPALSPIHLSVTSTTYFYCWGTDGKIERQDDSATAC